MVMPDPQFDLGKTIFKTVRKWHVRKTLERKTGKRHYWDEERAREVQQKCEEVTPGLRRVV